MNKVATKDKTKNKEMLVHLKDISIAFGGIKALSDVSVDLDEGEIIVLMGPNGAGKSTVLKCMFGIYKKDEGSVFWHEQEVNPVPYEMVRRGISYVPQGRQIFKSLSVRENLEMGGITLKSKKEVNEHIEDVLGLFPVLREKINDPSGSLSGGQQQMLAIARGLITDPKVLLLDEPSLGLSPILVKQVFSKVKEINEKRNTAIVIVEHNIKSILEIVDRAYLLDKGKLVAVDTPKNLLESTILEDIFMAKV